jgi:hypothetical protein
MSAQQANTMPTELDAALYYARAGIPVFPCNPLDKKPLTPNGYKDATTDEAQIRAWWARWPNAMIAMPAGPASGTWVTDTDKDPSKNIDGEATLAQLAAQHGAIPETLTSVTPRGGKHRHFTWDPNIEIRNSASKIGPGIDTRGLGGYVILPPSRTADGGTYRWETGGPGQAVPAPDWLITLARAKKTSAWAKAALEHECRLIAAAQPGTRNSTLNTSAFNLFQIVAGGSLDEQEVRDRLLEAAKACGLVADDGQASVEATIDSAAAAGKAQPRTRPQLRPRSGPRPVIQIIDGQLPRILNEIEEALLLSGQPIFSRADSLVEPIAESALAAGGRRTMVARLHALVVDSLLKPVAESATFQRYNRKRNAWVETDPPPQYVRQLLVNARCWKFPRINGLITTPTLRPDGTLLAEPGYDLETELYLLPGLQLSPISEHPTKDQARASLEILNDLLSEFSFKAAKGETEKRLNRSVALSGLLTALVRGSLPTAPLYLIRAHVAGTGKSHLVDAISMIATGRLCPVITALRNKEETEKRIGSILLSGLAIVSLDNCMHDLSGELLCQLAERPIIKIRILGRSEMPDCDCHTAVFATGNNITLTGDMVRRGLVCELEALEERPELRAFKHDILKRVTNDRGRYVAAGLTIIRAYLAAGAPAACGPLGSYSEWSRMVRSPLIWLGEPDPTMTMDVIRAEDTELADICEFFDLWFDFDLGLNTPYLSARIVEEACKATSTISTGLNLNPPVFRQFLMRVAASRDGTDVSVKRLGEWLRRISGRVVTRSADGRRYRLIRTQHWTKRAAFALEGVS